MNSRTLILCLFALVALVFVSNVQGQQEPTEDICLAANQPVPNMKQFMAHSSIAFPPPGVDECEPSDIENYDNKKTVSITYPDHLEDDETLEADWKTMYVCIPTDENSCLTFADDYDSIGVETGVHKYTYVETVLRLEQTVSIILENDAGLSEWYNYTLTPTYTPEPQVNSATYTVNSVNCDAEDNVEYSATVSIDIGVTQQQIEDFYLNINGEDVTISGDIGTTVTYTSTFSKEDLETMTYSVNGTNCAAELDSDGDVEGTVPTIEVQPLQSTFTADGFNSEVTNVMVYFTYSSVLKDDTSFTGTVTVDLFDGETPLDSCSFVSFINIGDDETPVLQYSCPVTVDTEKTYTGVFKSTACYWENDDDANPIEFSIESKLRTPSITVTVTDKLCPLDESYDFDFTVTNNDADKSVVVTIPSTGFEEIIPADSAIIFSGNQTTLSEGDVVEARYEFDVNDGNHPVYEGTFPVYRLPTKMIDSLNVAHIIHSCDQDENTDDDDRTRGFIVSADIDYLFTDDLDRNLEVEVCIYDPESPDTAIECKSDIFDHNSETHGLELTFSEDYLFRKTYDIEAQVSYQSCIGDDLVASEEPFEDEIGTLSVSYEAVFGEPEYNKRCTSNDDGDNTCYLRGGVTASISYDVEDVSGLVLESCKTNYVDGDTDCTASGSDAWVSFNDDIDEVDGLHRFYKVVLVDSAGFECNGEDSTKTNDIEFSPYSIELPNSGFGNGPKVTPDTDQCVFNVKFTSFDDYDQHRDNWFYCLVSNPDAQTTDHVCGDDTDNWFTAHTSLNKVINETDFDTAFSIYAYPSRCSANLLQDGAFDNAYVKTSTHTFPSPSFPTDVDEVDLDVEYNDRSCDLTSVIIDLKGSVKDTDMIELCIDDNPCFPAPYNGEDKFTITDASVLALVNNGQSVNVVIRATGKCGAENTELDLGTVTPSWPCDDSESESESGSGSSGSNSKSDSSSSEPQPGPSSASSAAISVLALIVAVFVVLF